ncbi:SlyX protein [Rhodanobacter sp. K2T2]|jgi:SlyX protein|uniref:SlyX family protein n=1 Tax=Rhodanobacter sp. K2T2 TaxID=2723085 RepID=UPI0015CEC0E6|nr:SlyX family protein [Rhodanobacter sp. K2T2]NYE27481.1 SlyX protein [Rhodanobacter sp. K2T2]
MNASNDTLEQRLTDMEVKLTFIDDTVQALASADADQSVRIASLERALRDLRGELSSMRIGNADDPHSEPPPPHY